MSTESKTQLLEISGMEARQKETVEVKPTADIEQVQIEEKLDTLVWSKNWNASQQERFVIGLLLFQPRVWGCEAYVQRSDPDVPAYSNFRCTNVASTCLLACAIRRAKAERMDVL